MREAVALKAVTLNVGVARFAHFISKIKGNSSCLFENFVCGPERKRWQIWYKILYAGPKNLKFERILRQRCF